MTDRQAREWAAHETGALAALECPGSGLLLHWGGNEGQDVLSCDVCDCGGYLRTDPRLGEVDGPDHRSRLAAKQHADEQWAKWIAAQPTAPDPFGDPA